MNRYLAFCLILVIGLGLPVGGTAQAAADSRYGEVHLAMPVGAIRGVVILFSDLSGWSDSDQEAAELLANHDVLAIGVDTAEYADALQGVDESCHRLVGDAEAISHRLQRELHASTYFPPILAGIGQGGMLAEQVLAVAPSDTVAGAISIDPAATLDPRFRPCPLDANFAREPGLPGFWSIGHTEDLPPAIQTLASSSGKTDVTGFPDGTVEADMLLSLTQPHLGSRGTVEDDVSDLPLIEIPAPNPSDMLAIVVSGDGGWRDIDKSIAGDLNHAGVGVVGLDSLRYFWSRKSPEQTAADLTRIIETYVTRWHIKSVALIGYSFGADVLPFAYNRLPKSAQDKVSILSLLGFGEMADFEIQMTGWLGMPASDEALPAAPEIAKVPPALVQCFYGEEEDDTDSLCPTLAGKGVAAIRMAGGHHFGGDYGKLTRIIIEGWRRRMTLG